MDGLMQPGAQPGAPPSAPPAGPAQEPPGDGSWLAGEDAPASPEEQELYEGVIARAWLVLYNPKVFPNIVKLLETGIDPVDQLAKAAAMLVYRVKVSADNAGKEIPGDVLLHAGKEIYEDLAMLAQELGTHDFMNDNAALEAGWLKALDEFRRLEESNGTLNKEAAQRDLQELQAADQSGALKEGFRALHAKGKQAPAVPVEEPVEEEEEGLMPRKKGAAK